MYKDQKEKKDRFEKPNQEDEEEEEAYLDRVYEYMNEFGIPDDQKQDEPEESSL